ncbi:MAG: hypothetical protein ACT6FG_00400 [Methanosarcinaceae archaeon]
MDGTIALGSMIIPKETAWKTAVIVLLLSIISLMAGFMVYIIHWLNT